MPSQQNIESNKLPEKNNQFIIFKTEDDKISVDVRFESETVWLTQAHLAELFQTSRPNITMHIKNILEEVELQEVSVCKDFLHTASDGKNYNTKYYNLDMIISLGYRINSKIATKFRQWATLRLKEYIVKGFTMDDERLKNLGGGGYWRELLDRIRDIRSSEKLIYRQVLDLYALSIDYDPKAEETLLYFKIVQNKLQIRNSTAEFLTFAYQSKGDGIEVRVQDGTIWLSQKNMGLLFDTSIDNIGLHLKNIFSSGELNADSVTEEYSVTATDGKNYRMKHYHLDAIITDSTAEEFSTIAALDKQHADNEFVKYRPIQDRLFESDFDRVMKMIKNKNENE
jgi:hypothetical protein